MTRVNIGSRRWLIGLLGGVIFLSGLGFGLYLTFMVAKAEVQSVFSMLATEMPTKPLKNLACPALLARHETRNVTASILNPLDRATGYSVQIYGTSIATGGQPTGPVVLSKPESTNGTTTSTGIGDRWICSRCTSKRAEVIIPSAETIDLTWRLSLTDDIRGKQIGLKLYAFGKGDDRIFSNGFPAWDFSYQGTCGIAIINLPGLTGRQVSGLALLSMLLGGILWLYGRTPLSRLNYIGAILGGLLWLILLWRLMMPIGPFSYPGIILEVLTYFVTPVLVLAFLIILVNSFVRSRYRCP